MPEEDAILSLAGGDRALANALRSSLRRLADGAGGPNLRWMAREALAGEFDLRQLGRLSMLRDDVERQFNALRAWRDEIGAAEFERQGQAAKQAMAEARRALDEAKESTMDR